MSRRPASDREGFWRRLICRQAAGGLTVGELCRQSGVSTASFYSWRRRLNLPGGRGPLFAAVRIAAESRNREVGGEIAVEVAIPRAGSAAQAVRVSIPPGCDETSIRNVLRAIMSAGDGGRGGC